MLPNLRTITIVSKSFFLILLCPGLIPWLNPDSAHFIRNGTGSLPELFPVS